MDFLLDDLCGALIQLHSKGHRAFRSQLLVETKYEREARRAVPRGLLRVDRKLARSAFEHAWAAPKSGRPICAMDSQRKNAFQSRAGSLLRPCTAYLRFQFSLYSYYLRRASVGP